MMSIIRNGLGFLLAAVAFVAYLSVFVVDEREKVIVQRLGEISRIVEKPGLYFKLPIVETVTPLEDRIVIWEINDRRVQDDDNEVYIVDSVTLARIENAQLFRERVGGSLAVAEERVGAFVEAALRKSIGRRDFDVFLTAERTKVMEEIRDAVVGGAKGLGIQIVDVRIRRTDLAENVLEATYTRMRTDRNKRAADLRAQGENLKTRVTAETDRMFTERTADARRQSEILRGEGEGEKNRIFADAFQKDPEFFSFYRSMKAYEKSLANGDTTLILDPQSDFFKYFGSQKDQAKVTTPQ